MALYSEEYQIPCYMFDCTGRLRPASFMDIAQELAEKGATQSGFSDRHLAGFGLVWILARMTVRFEAIPVRFDNVTAQTWHRGLDGLFLVRDYRLLESDGTPAATATASWIIMEAATRRIARNNRLEGIIPFEAEYDQSTSKILPDKIIPGKGVSFEPAGTRTVTYSDLDYNGHVNNARYVVWAFDCLPIDLVRNGTVKQYTVNFNREVLPGDSVDLYHGKKDAAHYIEGRIDKLLVFVIEILFR